MSREGIHLPLQNLFSEFVAWMNSQCEFDDNPVWSFSAQKSSKKKDFSPQKMHAIATYLYDKVELNSKNHTPYMQALFNLYRA